jgi:3,4-dihydroxy-2-butanone 4-phosphate synthase
VKELLEPFIEEIIEQLDAPGRVFALGNENMHVQTRAAVAEGELYQRSAGYERSRKVICQLADACPCSTSCRCTAGSCVMKENGGSSIVCRRAD